MFCIKCPTTKIVQPDFYAYKLWCVYRVRAALCTCTVRSVFSECEREGEWARFE